MQKEKRLSHTGNKECSEADQCPKGKEQLRKFLVHQPGSFTAQTQAGKGVRNQAEDCGHSGTKHLRISGGTVLRLLDVGLSKLCPKTNSQLRFAHGLQVKNQDFAHKGHTW